MARQLAEQFSKRQPLRRAEYQPEYCEKLINHMAQGYSFHSFGSVINVSASVMRDWKATYEEFEQAAQIGEVKSVCFWEKVLIEQATGITSLKGNAKLIELVMKCRFLWAEKQHIELTGALETQLRQLSDQQLDIALRKLRAGQTSIAGDGDDTDIDAALDALKGS